MTISGINVNRARVLIVPAVLALGLMWVTWLTMLWGLAQAPGSATALDAIAAALCSIAFWGSIFGPNMLGTVNATLRGVIIRFGKPVDTLEPGLYALAWPIERIAFVPVEPLELEMFFEEIMTRPGVYVWKPRTKKIKGTKQAEVEEECDRLVLGVGFAIYWPFGLDEPSLFEAVSNLDPRIFEVPDNRVIAQRLVEYIDSDAEMAVRGVGGEQTWADIVDRRGMVERAIRKLLLKTVTIQRSGLSDEFDVAILRVVFPQIFLDSQNAKAAARNNADATRRAAEGARDAAIAAATGNAEATKLQSTAELFKAKKDALGTEAKGKAAARVERFERQQVYEVMGLPAKGGARPQFELQQEYIKNLPKDMKPVIISSSMGDALQQLYLAGKKFFTPQGTNP